MIDALGVTSCCGAVGGHIERSKVIFQNQLAIGPTILMDGNGHRDISSYFHKWARHYIANALSKVKAVIEKCQIYFFS